MGMTRRIRRNIARNSPQGLSLFKQIQINAGFGEIFARRQRWLAAVKPPHPVHFRTLRAQKKEREKTRLALLERLNRAVLPEE